MRLEGKVAFISGGARGMGAVEAELFASHGAKVVIGDVLIEEGRLTAQRIVDQGGQAHFEPLDVTDEGQWASIVNETVDRFGGLDVLVNNAGIYRIATIEQTSMDVFRQIMEVNVTGVFLGTRTVIPEMRKRGGGSIINISSTAGLAGSANSSAYQASKGAVRIFTKSTAIEHVGSGIRANSVHPGMIDTDMITVLLKDPEERRQRIASVPLGRVGTALDVAYAVLYLASDESSFVTGAELVIDGGKTAQ
jgi:NAD(P)-dependent dehydrogenase (short-subunit alcohol dehydrogenase family)